jgi:hypothetical protein
MAGMLCSILTYAQHAACNTILLNGTWQIAEGKKDIVPAKFDHTIQVPGLLHWQFRHLKMLVQK